MKDTIYILIESDTDDEFYEAILEPILYEKYAQVISYKYIERKKTDVVKYLNVIRKQKADYFVLGDKDEDTKADAIKRIFKRMDNKIIKNRIRLIIKEMECWILAGLNNEMYVRYDIQLNINNTEIYCKEEICDEFKKHLNPSQFITAILNTFNLSNARLRNKSFDTFIKDIEDL